MKKKLLTVLFALAMTGTVITGCSTKDDSSSDKDDKKSEASATKNDDATVAPSDDATVAPSDNATAAPSDDATAAPSDDATVAPSDSSTTTKMFKDMEDYITNPTIKAALDKTIESVSGSGMKIDISAEDNTLVYKYSYETQMSSDTVPVSTLAQSLETAMESQKDQMQSFTNQIGDAVEKTPAIVKIQYLDADGTLLYEKEFTAQ